MSAIPSLSSGILILWSELWADRYSFSTWEPQSQMLSWRKLYQLLFVWNSLFYFKNKSKGGATCNSLVVRGTPRGEWRGTLLSSAWGGIKLAAPGTAPATKPEGCLLPPAPQSSVWLAAKPPQPLGPALNCQVWLQMASGDEPWFVLPVCFAFLTKRNYTKTLLSNCPTPARTPVNIFPIATVKSDSPSSIVEKNAKKVAISQDSSYNSFYVLYINSCKDWSNYISSYSLNAFTMHYVTSKVTVTFFLLKNSRF